MAWLVNLAGENRTPTIRIKSPAALPLGYARSRPRVRACVCVCACGASLAPRFERESPAEQAGIFPSRPREVGVRVSVACCVGLWRCATEWTNQIVRRS